MKVEIKDVDTRELETFLRILCGGLGVDVNVFAKAAQDAMGYANDRRKVDSDIYCRDLYVREG
jgi:hypothetical protein